MSLIPFIGKKRKMSLSKFKYIALTDMELPVTIMEVNCTLEAIEAAADCVQKGAAHNIYLC